MIAKNSNANAGQEHAAQAVSDGLDSFSKNFGQFSEMVNENLQACFKASAAWNKNAQLIFEEGLSASRKTLDEAVSDIKQTAGTQSVEDVIAVQSRLSKRYFDTCTAYASRLNKIFISASKEVSEPFTQQVANFSDFFGACNAGAAKTSKAA